MATAARVCAASRSTQTCLGPWLLQQQGVGFHLPPVSVTVYMSAESLHGKTLILNHLCKECLGNVHKSVHNIAVITHVRNILL